MSKCLVKLSCLFHQYVQLYCTDSSVYIDCSWLMYCVLRTVFAQSRVAERHLSPNSLTLTEVDYLTEGYIFRYQN